MMHTQTLVFWRKAYYDLAREVEQTLGKALGYPYYSDDQKNFPGTTKDDGVCVGDHVPESLLDEAARKLSTKPPVVRQGYDLLKQKTQLDPHD